MNVKQLVFWLILCTSFAIGRALDDGENSTTDNDKFNDIEIPNTTITDDDNTWHVTNEYDYDGTTEELIAENVTDDNGFTTNTENETETETETETEAETESVLLTGTEIQVENATKSNLETLKARKSAGKCRNGLILPAWRPIENLTTGDRFARGLVYFLAMCYLFLGVSIVSDRFMAAIEKITAIEKSVSVRRPDGTQQQVIVRVWNETVANLTLMALGTSAPEILLSIIEVFTNKFEAGQLGPGTIVGSAAYNLFTIIAICIMVIPKGEVRRIKHLRVFFVTATWSIFAYIWLYLILAVFSPGVVAIWEGLITFLCFPLIVWMAYVADRRMLVYKYLNKGYRMNERGVMVQMETTDHTTPMPKEQRSDSVILESDGTQLMSDEFTDLEKLRLEYIKILQDLRTQYPQFGARATLEMMAQERLLNSTPKSHAFYRVQAGRKLLGGGNVVRRIAERTTNEVKADLSQVHVIDDDDLTPKICFEPNHYTVMENCGSVDIRIMRHGDFSGHVSVDYQTQDGSAEAGTDYIAQSGTITFTPGISERFIKIDIVDDDIFEVDENFYIQLSNPTNGAVLGANNLATIMILDDDHGGFFSFAESEHELIETVGIYELKVVRASGARGTVTLPYWTEDGSAKGGKAYETQSNQLIFNNNETEKTIPLVILEEGSYEKDVLFYVNLGEPQMVGDDELANAITEAEAKAPEDLTDKDKMALLGRPKMGDITRAQLRIKESKEFKNTVDKLVQRANASLLIGTSSWKEQFIDALTVSAGDDNSTMDETDGDCEEPSPSCGNYVMHFLTLFWKILFAFIPPTDIYGGYVCFVVSIFAIGVVTAVIGDVASHFGCTLGIKDSVTAIVFVALGTSVPDTFASKVAAIQDKYADASVGNVTGSNAVNVFLGIGVAWTIAAVYHWWNGSQFLVEPGNLAFSVTLFCSEAVIAIIIILARRVKAIGGGGELGGPALGKYISSGLLFGLWIIYLVMSSLEAYGVIKGF